MLDFSKVFCVFIQKWNCLRVNSTLLLRIVHFLPFIRCKNTLKCFMFDRVFCISMWFNFRCSFNFACSTCSNELFASNRSAHILTAKYAVFNAANSSCRRSSFSKWKFKYESYVSLANMRCASYLLTWSAFWLSNTCEWFSCNLAATENNGCRCSDL